MEFGKIIDGKLVKAPNVIEVNGAVVAAPAPTDYIMAGYREIAVLPPSPPSGYMVESTNYEERDGVISAAYVYAPIPPAPKVYSKLKLIVAAKAMGMWDALKGFITAQQLDDEWSACQYLSSDYPQFVAAKAAVINAGIATAEEVEQILADAED